MFLLRRGCLLSSPSGEIFRVAYAPAVLLLGALWIEACVYFIVCGNEYVAKETISLQRSSCLALSECLGTGVGGTGFVSEGSFVVSLHRGK